MDVNKKQKFLTGPAKLMIYLRIILHVIFHYAVKMFKGNLGPVQYVRFLFRAYHLLLKMRFGKIVKLNGLYHIHLYVPAYPTKAFFHLLDKLYRSEPGPGTVVFSMTKACRYRCPHCYQKNDAGKDLDIELMTDVAKEMQEMGVAFFDIEGGEPFLHPERLMALVEGLDDRAEIWVNSTGDRASAEEIRKLKEAGLNGFMISIHSPDPERHDNFTGIDGSFDSAVKILEMGREEGLFTAINCCPNQEAILNGDLERLFELAERCGCSYVQVIHEKAAGGWLSRAGEVSQGQPAIEKLHELHHRYNSGRYRNYPSVSAQVFEEQACMFGCTAGGIDRFYIGADGEVQPCEFLNVSFGNVNDESFNTIFKRMRSHFPTPGTNWLCCTEAESIRKAIEENNLERTPVPWEMTKILVTGWDKGEETPLYKKIGLYRKS